MFELNIELFNIAYNELKNNMDLLLDYRSLFKDLKSNIPDCIKNKQDEISEIISDYFSCEKNDLEIAKQMLTIKQHLEEASYQEQANSKKKDDGGFFNSAFNAIKDTCAAWGNGVSGVFRGEGFGGVGNAMAQTGATIYVASNSLASGVAKVGETLGDGVAWVGGMSASGWVSLFNKDASNNIKNSTMNYIRRDLVGEDNQKFFENEAIGKWINSKSNLKYDSSAASGFQTGTEFASKIALATAATVFTGGAAAPVVIGAAYGIGNEEEKYAQSVNIELGEAYDYKKVFGRAAIGGVSGAAEFYGYGQLGSGIVNGIKGLKSGASSLSAETGVGNITTSFRKNFAKNFFVTDTLLDTGAVITKHGIGYAIGDESREQLFKEGGLELAFSLGLAAIGSGLSAHNNIKGNKKILKTYNTVNDFFDKKLSYSSLDDLIASENLDMSLLKYMTPDEATALVNKISKNSNYFNVYHSNNNLVNIFTINQLDDVIKNNKIDSSELKRIISDLDTDLIGNQYIKLSKDSKKIIHNNCADDFLIKIFSSNDIDDLNYRAVAQDMNDKVFRKYLLDKKIIDTSRLSNKSKYYNDWASTEMIDKFNNSNFSDVISSDKLKLASNNIYYLDDSFFSKLDSTPGTAGLNVRDSGDSIVNIGLLSDDVIKHNSIHETIHALSRGDEYIGGFSIDDNYVGLNEAMTELLARNISGDKWDICKYNNATDCLNDIIDLGIDNLNFQNVGEAYFKNDLNFFYNNISKVYGDRSLTDSLLFAFDEVSKNPSSVSKLEMFVDDLALASKKNR